MNYLVDSITQAFSLIAGFNKDVYLIVWTSFWIAITSALVSAMIGAPMGIFLAVKKFHGKRIVITIINTLMAIPTVVIGLVVYSFLTRNGPLGSLKLLFSPTAIIIGQVIVATPIIAAMVLSVTQNKDRPILKTAYGLGASPLTAVRTLIWEIKVPLLAAIMAGFGRVVGEVGVSMMLGGNIYHYTRTMTTAIALETSKGEFSLALALGVILLVVALSVNSFVSYFNYRSEVKK